MNLKEFAREVHENARAHGWWDDENKNLLEVAALINSEWSEALEEFRAGRPMLWHACEFDEDGKQCNPDCVLNTPGETCPYRDRKPEGVAVELIDGCIRILDFLGYCDVKYTPLYEMFDRIPASVADFSLPELVAVLAYETSKLTYCGLTESEEMNSMTGLANALSMALYWVKVNELDPEAIMLEKHEFNKRRPYRHGGKVI